MYKNQADQEPIGLTWKQSGTLMLLLTTPSLLLLVPGNNLEVNVDLSKNLSIVRQIDIGTEADG